MRDSDRRAIRLGVASVLFVAIARLTILPAYETYAANRLDLQKERRLLADDLGLLDWSTESTAEATAIARLVHEELSGLFQGSDLNLISGDVEDYLRSFAETAHMQISQLRITPDPKQSGALHKLVVELTAKTDYNGLLHFLMLIEADARIIHVTDLNVQGVHDATLALALGMESQLLELRARMITYALDPLDDYSLAKIERRATTAVAHARGSEGQ